MELKEKYKEFETVHKNFISLFKKEDFFLDFDQELKEVEPFLLEIGNAFKSNLTSVISILYFPIVLSSSRTKQYIFDRLLTQELILNAPMPDLGEDSNKQNENQKKINRIESLETAKEKFYAKLKTKEGALEYWKITFGFLLDCLDSNDDLKISAQQLIRQGLILLWTSFEVLARDFTEYYLNKNPEFFKEFGIKSLSTEILEKYNFKVENKLGDIYTDMQDWSKISNIKKTFMVIQSENNELLKRLNDNKLWNLNQRRHLIVHRSSIVDKKYFNSTSDKIEIGKELQITPNEIIESLYLIKEIGLIILNSK
jgi:hypothetical protein